ncbi:MAG: hypothetical protein ACYCW6_23960 [Candidatus Xenobia bacterium]
MSIVEVLISGTLTVLVLGLVLATLKMGKDAYHQAADSGPAFRNATTGLDAVSSELRDCAHIYQPDAVALASGFHPVDRPLVVVEAGGGGAVQVVALQQLTGGSVDRRLYDAASFNPKDGSTWTLVPGSERVVAVGARDLTITQLHQEAHTFLKVSIMTPGGTPVETMVECFRVPDPVEPRP